MGGLSALKAGEGRHGQHKEFAQAAGARIGMICADGGWSRAFCVVAMRGGSDAAERTYELNSMRCVVCSAEQCSAEMS